MLFRLNFSDKVHALYFSKEVTGWHKFSVSLKRVRWFFEKMNRAIEATVYNAISPEARVNHCLISSAITKRSHAPRGVRISRKLGRRQQRILASLRSLINSRASYWNVSNSRSSNEGTVSVMTLVLDSRDIANHPVIHSALTPYTFYLRD